MTTKSRTISKDIRDPSPDVRQWRTTLRSRSPSPTRNSMSNSMEFDRSMVKSRPFSQMTPQSRTTTTVSNSGDFASLKDQLSKSLTSTNVLEQEYIKGLQQQIYLLELENNHLRQQASKATELHPVMTAEAENMLAKLKDMQNRIDSLELEIFRKDGNVDILNNKIIQITNKLKEEASNHSKEKDLLMSELVQVRKEHDLLEREISRRDLQLRELKDDYSRTLANYKAAETKIESLKGQLDQEVDRVRRTELALGDKRAEQLHAETRLCELEEKYYTSTARLQDQAKQDLRNEIYELRQKLKDAEMAAENDRFLRSKLSDDAGRLVKENAVLNQRILEMQRELDRELSIREGHSTKRSQELLDLARLREREKELQYEISELRRELHGEKERSESLMEQPSYHHVPSRTPETMKRQDKTYATQSLESNFTQKRLAESEHSQQTYSDENSKLQRDKEYLLDHIQDLQRQLNEKETEVIDLNTRIHSMGTRLTELERVKGLEEQVQSQRWEELEKLADSLRSHAHLMASSGTPHPLVASAPMPDH